MITPAKYGRTASRRDPLPDFLETFMPARPALHGNLQTVTSNSDRRFEETALFAMFLASKNEAYVQLATMPGPDGAFLEGDELLGSALDLGIQMMQIRLHLLGHDSDEIGNLAKRYRALEARMQDALAEIESF